MTHARSFALPFVIVAITAGCSSGSPDNDVAVTGGSGPSAPAAGSGGGGASGAATAGGTAGTSLGGGGASAGTGGSSAGGGLGGTGGAAGMAGSGGSVPSSPHADPGSEGDGIQELTAPYQDAPEFTRDESVPRGKMVRFMVTSSTIYPNTGDREIAVYVPAQYQKGTPAAVMVFQDGTDFFGFDDNIPTVFDNLIAQGKLPPLVGVFAGNGGGDYIGSQRGLEYDTVSGLYAQWVDQELLPRAEQETLSQLPEQAVTFTKDPEGRAAMGGSSGGAGSFSMAWWRPDLFRKVIAYSGTFVNQVPQSSPFPKGAWIYHDIDPYQADAPNGLIVAHCESQTLPPSSKVEACDTPRSQASCEAVSGCRWNTTENKPLRVWLQAGSNDLGAGDGPGSYRNFYLANQRMAKALQKRGYHFHYDDCKGAGHVDQKALRETLPTALVWLWRGYNANL